MMGMPSEKAVGVRDALNRLIEGIEGVDKESYILRCCVAVAVEEVENYMYGGAYTPSVMPVSHSGKPLVLPDGVRDFGDVSSWSNEEMKAFREGKAITFIKGVRTRITKRDGVTGGLKEAKAYFDAMRVLHSDLWEVDKQ